MDDLLHKLAAHRRRIRGARVADAALRWAFYASVAACLALLVSKFAGIALPGAAAAGALAAVPAAMALREWSRAFSLRDCAIHLDRLLGLDERLSTAVETSGAMALVLRADAEGALARTPVPPRRLPREGKLLAGSLVLLGVLFSIPSPGRSGAKGDPAFEAATAAEAAKLESLGNVEVQFKGPRSPEAGQGRRSVALLQSSAGSSPRAARRRRGRAGDGRCSTRRRRAPPRSPRNWPAGRTIHAPPAAVAQAKLERQKTLEQGTVAAASPASAAVSRAAFSDSAPWNPRYDAVIRRYFGREP